MAKGRLFLLAALSAAGFGLIAGNENFPVGARPAALANATVSSPDLWSIGHNQAGLGFLKEPWAGIYYENRFLLKEISLRAVALVLPLKNGSIGVSMNNFGYHSYSENKYSVAYSQLFGNKFSAGIALNYHTTTIAESYGKMGIATAELGFVAKPFSNFTLAVHVFNPATINRYQNAENPPAILRMGGNYSFSKKVLVLFEAQKDISKKTEFKAAIEYQVVKDFYLRMGLSSNPNLSSFGIGYSIRNLQIDFASTFHQVLGYSPQLGISYKFVKRKQSVLIK